MVADVDTTNLTSVAQYDDGNGNFSFTTNDGILVFSPEVDTVEYAESDFTKILTYKDVSIYVYADDLGDDSYTDYIFYVKNGTDYYRCWFEVNGYFPHTEDTTIPNIVAKHIDALSVYINGNKAELATYPNVV